MNRFSFPACLAVFAVALWLAAPARAQLTFVATYDFTGAVGFSYAVPYAGLVQGSDGCFYGTTRGGGSLGGGTVFKISSAGVLTTLVNFPSASTGPYGNAPVAALIQGSDGNFYGTTAGGGQNGTGTVFQMTPAGTLTTLYSFSDNSFGTNSDGSEPSASLVQGSDGCFYGTTPLGGSSGDGTVFKVTSSGVETTLVDFTGPNGACSYAALIQGSDGCFYGTTQSGGSSGYGTVFQITSSGALTTLYNFTGPDGGGPVAALTQGSDGCFYGTTQGGGSSDFGTAFQITSSGALTTLYDFTGLDGIGPNGLIQGSDGCFYGTTVAGGQNGSGTVFQVTSSGVLTTLYNFSDDSSGTNSDGGYPIGSLVQGSDGNFYGTAQEGGSSGQGTVFGLFGPPTASGAAVSTNENAPVTFTVAFDDPSGEGIASAAFPAPPAHGTLTVGAITETGTTGTVVLTYTPAADYSGADSFTYTVTSSVVGTSAPQTVTISVEPINPPTITAYAPGAGYVGTPVMITGTDFTGATLLTFGGTATTFKVVSSTSIAAIVPAGAVTGHLSVTTPLGTNTTYGVFEVLAPDAPDITGYTVGAGPEGTVVAIFGDNFTGATSALFNGAAASFTVISPTSIEATVPAGATTGHLTVATPVGSYTTPGVFVVLPPGSPTVTAYAPGSGSAGTSVTITGTNFTGATSVLFNGMAASFTVVSSTSIEATVPTGATTGHISVMNPAGTFTTPGVFIVN